MPEWRAERRQKWQPPNYGCRERDLCLSCRVPDGCLPSHPDCAISVTGPPTNAGNVPEHVEERRARVRGVVPPGPGGGSMTEILRAANDLGPPMDREQLNTVIKALQRSGSVVRVGRGRYALVGGP